MNVDIQGGEAIVRLLTKKGQEVTRSRFTITGIEKSKTVYGTEQRVLELMLISQKSAK